MQALILSCSTGGGHNAAAGAMKKMLSSRGWQTVMFDPYTLKSKRLADLVGDAYVKLVRWSPALFGKVYRIGELYEKAENALSLPSPVLEAQRSTAHALGRYLDRMNFDLIICTHPYPGMMIHILKREGKKVPPSVMVATDYTCIPFETEVGCDWMVLGSPDLKDEFIKAGADPEMLLCTGIPVDDVFEHGRMDKDRCCKDLGLDCSLRWLLAAGGSMGSGGTLQMIEKVRTLLDQHPELGLAVLCGTGEDLKKRIEKLNHPRIKAAGFTREAAKWMSACDVYITKPGGLTITESAALGMPLLLTGAIPGCETCNAEFFERRGMAQWCRDLDDLPDMIEDLLMDDVQEKMLECQKSSLPHKSAEKLAEWCEAAVLFDLPHRRNNSL